VKSLKIVGIVILTLAPLQAQIAAQVNAALPVSRDPALQNLQDEVHELRELIEQMRAENAQSNSEIQALRQELQETRELLTPLVASKSALPPVAGTTTPPSAIPTETASTQQPASALKDRVQRLEDSTSLLNSKSTSNIRRRWKLLRSIARGFQESF